MTLTNQRNSNVEMLRIVLMFGILLWHVTVHGYGLAHMSEGNVSVEHPLVNALCTALFAPCVNLFVLISGYYGMKLKTMTLLRFELQAVFYSYVLAVVMYFAFHDLGTSLVSVAFPVIGNHWWFLHTYIMLLLLSPVINEGVKRLTERQHLAIIALLVIINGIGFLLRRVPNGSNLQSFILVYIIGQYLWLYRDKYRRLYNCKLLLIGGVICVAINLLIVVFSLHTAQTYPKAYSGVFLWLSYSNPVILLQTVCIFCAVLSLRPSFSRCTNAVAKHVFAVYLITETFGIHLYGVLRDIFNRNFFLGIAAAAVVFAACIAVENVRSKLSEALLNKAHAWWQRRA